MVSDRSRARSSVKRRRNGINGDGGRYGGSLELNDLLPAIKRESRFEICLEISACVADRSFGTKQLVEFLAFDVLATHQTVDCDAKRQRHHGGAREAASVLPQAAGRR